MSWTRARNRSASGRADVIAIERAGGGDGKRGSIVLPFPPDTRERLTAFYRECDVADAARCASGAQKARGAVWAVGLKRLEAGEDAYESYRVLSSAGIECPAAVEAILDQLPVDWRQICRIDADGTIRAASLKKRMRSGR